MEDRGFTSKDAEHWDDALDDERKTDHKVPVQGDERSPARTGFNPNGSDYKDDKLNNYKKWNRLDEINHGKHESEYRERRRDEEKLRDVDVVASRFEITEYQKERCKHIMESIDDLRNIGTWDRLVVAFALVTLVVNEDNRHIQTEEMYGDFIDDMEADRSAVNTARERLREYL